MNVSNRQRQILELLLNRNIEITAGEIATEIKVSTRTVHRELPELEKIVAAYGVTLHKKSGFGIQIQANPQQLNELAQSLFHKNHRGYSTQERQALIICWLLAADEPIKLFALAHDLLVTVPTISSDLDQVEVWIHKMGLTLVRRRGFGVQLEGSEEMKRKVIYQLAKDHLDDSALFGNASAQPLQPITAALLSMIGKDCLMKVEHALWSLEDQWPIELSEGAYTDLLIQLSVAITRIRKGNGIQPSGETTLDEGSLPKGIFMAQQLSKSLDLTLSPEEAAYIAKLLVWEEDSFSSRLLPQDDLSLIETVIRLIRAMEELTHVPLSEDRSLRDGLLNHIEPVLQRIQEDIQIRNPLLAQIKKNYEVLFGFVRQAVDQTFKLIEIPDEEIGFLVMHFGASMERLKQLSRNLKAIVVCTSGIGSSKLLAVRLGKEMPQIEIINHVTWYEASRIPESAYDLIISTVDLPLDAGQYIKLSPLLTKDEIEKLRHYVRDITLKRSSSENRDESSGGKQALDQLHNLKAYLDEIVSLIDHFEIFHLESSIRSQADTAADLRETLQKVIEAVNQDGRLTETEPVVELLLERERHGTQVIPDTRLALFHTRSEQIHKPILSTFRLSDPLTLDPEHPTQIHQLVLMLGPLELSKESLEVLSEISALLLLPEMIHTLETGTSEEIKQFLSNELLTFYKNKTEMGRVNL